jgi:hypothetical protein
MKTYIIKYIMCCDTYVLYSQLISNAITTCMIRHSTYSFYCGILSVTFCAYITYKNCPIY